MKTVIISFQNPIKFDQMEELLKAFKMHLDFYVDQEPDIIRLSEEYIVLNLNRELDTHEQVFLQESIEIDLPFVQVSFTNKH